MEQLLTLYKTQGRIAITLRAFPLGNDLCVVINGGAAHLGAVAVSQVRSSLADPAALSSSTSLITLFGHKEDRLAQQTAEHLSRALGKNVVTICGIHLDEITPEEVRQVLQLTEQLVEECLRRVRAGS
ncbi:MAG: hypothetical protein LBT32_01635 [Peptococcaceae bacterium]|jgi:hypothetical protein|nr:hypothetical protein [Peptococcaceae bacterium]